MASAVDIVALVRVLGRISAEELPKTDSNDSNLAQVAMEIDLSVLNDLEAHSKICIESTVSLLFFENYFYISLFPCLSS